MDRNIDEYFEDRNLAVSGRINLRPLYTVLLVNLALAYLSYALYDRMAGLPLAEAITRVGRYLSPSVIRVPTISMQPDRCAFVLSIQWVASAAYVVLFLTRYWPFSRIMKVAVHAWYKQPESKLPPHRTFKLFAFMLFVLACAAGDMGAVRFPTLYNGQLFADGEPLDAFVPMVNSPTLLPLLAWFAPFATVTIYWGSVFVIANWWTIVE